MEHSWMIHDGIIQIQNGLKSKYSCDTIILKASFYIGY